MRLFRAIRAAQRTHLKRYYNLDFRNRSEARQKELRKRALVSYIVHPFSISPKNPRFFRHINIWRSYEFVRILNELGFLVDVVDYRDEDFIPKKKYDLFIGHVEKTFLSIAGRLPAGTKKIYFSTSNYWRFRNRAVIARYADLRKRKNVELQPPRLVNPEQDAALEMADGIIGIGGDFGSETYSDFNQVFMVNNTALADDRYPYETKDFEKGKGHFLFFAGQENVRKGLDLLLEAFRELDEHLWICTFIEKRIAEIYAEELGKTNIHPIGNILPRSRQFYELMDTCNFIILPSCNEGQPHSVIECMNYGLIPIVSRACNIDVAGFGRLLETCSVEEIRETVRECSSIDPASCHRMSAGSIEEARTKYSEASFRSQMTRAFSFLIAQ